MNALAKPRASVWSERFATADQMAMAQRDAKLEYLSMAGRVDYGGRLSVVDLGTLRFQDATDDAHVVRGRIDPARAVILLPRGRPAAGLKVNGWGDWSSAGMLLRGGSELLSVAPEPQAWCALVLSEESFGALLDRPGLPAQGGFAVLPRILAELPGLSRLATDLSAVAWADPDRLCTGTAPAALADEIGCYAARACGEIGQGAPHARQLGRRLRLVARAEDYLQSRLGDAIYTGDVAAAIGASERGLSEAFGVVYGMSLQRYLLLRRLNQVHRTLSATGGGMPLVKTIALDYGFWNLGRFARAYRDLFGENPSATARRGPVPGPPPAP